jgi:hypothetical protein
MNELDIVKYRLGRRRGIDQQHQRFVKSVSGTENDTCHMMSV